MGEYVNTSYDMWGSMSILLMICGRVCHTSYYMRGSMLILLHYETDLIINVLSLQVFDGIGNRLG